ncbi:iron(III) transport system substrate-binding protein [Paraburkholderia fungorum]|uniref:Iron(III) transport system substrate-binding protein n=1 Tax=Paraburkholderia fungorum TaxID=134537 RepID=A0A1H1JVK6_9BURK|nr:extracellular solute-binding protein [Paraburkholderia fungorum]SDR53872.1 iron(III) transport system substrate-binding protein [Paraburkholderia fungorum]
MAQYSRRDVLKLGGAIATVAGLTSAKFAFAAETPAAAKLYIEAKKEGELNLYWGSYEQKTIEAIRDAFIARYPGIRVNLLRQGSQTVYTRLRLELQRNAPNCDSLGTTNLLHYTELKKINALLPYVPEDARFLPEQFRQLDPDNMYHIGAISLTAINYQSQRVKTAPASWKALLSPEYAGKITVGSPAASGDVAHWALAMRTKFGDGYLRDFAKLNPKVGQSNVDTVTDILAGERIVGAGAPVSYTLAQRAAGQPINVQWPTDDTILNLGLTAIPAKAPHPNAAKLFNNFLYSTEVSQILSRNLWPTLRTDVPWSDGQSLDKLKWYRNKTDNLEKQMADTVALWQSIFS